MIRALLLLSLAAPDGGVDAPWKETRDGATIVCMTEATAVLAAKAVTNAVITGADEEKVLLKTDPAPFKIALGVAIGLVVGGMATAGAVCLSGHCR